MKNVMIVIGVIVLGVFIVGGIFVGSYNKLVTLNESITAAWAQVENQLQRRNDLIPNLIESVKGYMAHEKEVFEKVVEARAKLGSARTINEKIAANQQVETALSRLLAIVENYPNLKANENFIRLQDELAGTENRVAVERMRYNEVVQMYNITIKRFPSNIIAGMFNFEKKDVYFKAQEEAKQVPQVKF